MPAVITLDQRASREAEDLVPLWLEQLNEQFKGSLGLPFVRTAGDELQALVEIPEAIVEIILRGVRADEWWVGIGIGSVETLGASSADSRGPAFYHAREAVNEAKGSRYGFAVVGDDFESAQLVRASLDLLCFVVQRRGSSPSSKGWEAVELAARGLNTEQIGQRLGISRQAAWQRLRVAGWEEEVDGRWLAARLISAAMRPDARPR